MKKIFENWREYTSESGNLLSENPDIAKKALANTLSAESVFKDSSLNEQNLELDFEVSLSDNINEETVKRFMESLYSGKRSGFLSYYNENDLKDMNLYIVKGYNAGFAVKNDGDIVSVHNNSSLKGLGNKFLSKAIAVGGNKLDHFDGFLSGLYRNFGFTNVYEVYQWDEKYKPEKWVDNEIKITDQKTSIYAIPFKKLLYKASKLSPQQTLPNEEIIVRAEDKFKIKINPNEKYNQYKYGMPDVVFRRLK